MKKLMQKYREWRQISEKMLSDGFSGTTDCGESSTREDFSVFAGLTETISFEAMLGLETGYNGELSEATESVKEPLNESTLIWDKGQRKLLEEKRQQHEVAKEEYALGK